MLIILCEVCTTPYQISQKTEKMLLNIKFVVCPICRQISKVPEVLKENIRENMTKEKTDHVCQTKEESQNQGETGK